MKTITAKAKVNLNGETTIAYLTVNKKDSIIHAEMLDVNGTLRNVLINLTDVIQADRPRIAKELLKLAA